MDHRTIVSFLPVNYDAASRRILDSLSSTGSHPAERTSAATTSNAERNQGRAVPQDGKWQVRQYRAGQPTHAGEAGLEASNSTPCWPVT